MTPPKDVQQKLKELDRAFVAFQKHVAALRKEQQKTVAKIVDRVEKQKLSKIRSELS